MGLMIKKRVLITGVTGQDGSYLAELLLGKGYEVFGLVRRSATPNYWRIEHILKYITLIEGDLGDQSSIFQALEIAKPDEVYNLAAQSFVAVSFTQPETTANITGLGVLRLLEAVKQYDKTIKVYQASSSEMFGKVKETPQKETTPLHSRSPYGSAKVYAHLTAGNYRDSYDMFICCGILFNHEGVRRGIEFVTRKITDGVAKIKLGLSSELRLGNLDSKRDWGDSRDYVEAMYLMMQKDKPDDYVIATGITHSIKDLCRVAFSHVGLNWEDYVTVDQRFVRPAEVDLLLGDASKAKRELGWSPKITFEQMIRDMVDEDLIRNQKT